MSSGYQHSITHILSMILSKHQPIFNWWSISLIYSNLLPDSSILKSVEDYEALTLVLCPYCGNHSVGYQKDIPILKKVIDKATGEPKYRPWAIVSEATRLKQIFEDQGKQVKTEIYGGPCLTALDQELPGSLNGGDADILLLEGCVGSDIVLTLCCATGTIGVKKRLGDEYRVVSCMKTVGLSHFSFKFDETNTFVYVDQENSTIIPYN